MLHFNSIWYNFILSHLRFVILIPQSDTYLVVVLQLLVNSWLCHSNTRITKVWATAINLSIYTWFSWNYFIEQFSMFSSKFETQVHHSKLIWTFQTNCVKYSTQSSWVIQNTFLFKLFCIISPLFYKCYINRQVLL